MNTGREQLDRLRLAARHWAIGGGVLVVASAAWAVWPQRSEPVAPAQLRVATPGPAVVKVPTIDIAAFNAPIWNPTPPAKPAAPLPPLRLQLVAITGENAADGERRFRAAVYDPDTDSLFQVIAGEKVAGRSVIRVTATELEIADATGPRRLVLDVLAPGGAP